MCIPPSPREPQRKEIAVGTQFISRHPPAKCWQTTPDHNPHVVNHDFTSLGSMWFWKGKGWEFMFPDAICMQLADNYGLFICTWPQIITDWCLADGLDLLQIPHMLHFIPNEFEENMQYFDRKMGSLYFRWNCGIGSYNGWWRDTVNFFLISLHIQKANRKKTTCSQNVTATGSSSDWNRKEWPSPHWQTVGFLCVFFNCLIFLLFSHIHLFSLFPPSCVCTYYFVHIIKDLRQSTRTSAITHYPQHHSN